MSVYNPIENDDYTLRPAIEPPPPDKLTAALCAMLQDVLTFTRTPSFGRVRVQGEADLPPAITLGNDEVLIVVSEAVQEPVDLGGTKGTLGVRRTKRITWNLHAVISSVQQPRAQRSRVAQNIALYVERAIAANGLLPDAGGRGSTLLPACICRLRLASVAVWLRRAGRTDAVAQPRNHRDAPLVTYWMATDMAGVGSGH
jgi:hypothetical protein